jgi:hypothetical protein
LMFPEGENWSEVYIDAKEAKVFKWAALPTLVILLMTGRSLFACQDLVKEMCHEWEKVR